jgi:hypothetical protein
MHTCYNIVGVKRCDILRILVMLDGNNESEIRNTKCIFYNKMMLRSSQWLINVVVHSQS